MAKTTANTSYVNIQEAIGYTFKDVKLLKSALTHSSYANEKKTGIEDNQRLEFLGDAVLSVCVCTLLYLEYPKLPEGSLTKIRAAVVSEPPLAEAARALKLGSYLLLGRGEESTGGRARPSVLSDGMEALIAAVYLDGGLEAAQSLVSTIFSSMIEKAAKGKGRMDYKTDLQELLQKDAMVTLTYQIVDENGPDHAKAFTAQVRKDGSPIGLGTGHSKKEAEQSAAKNALETLKEVQDKCC